MFAPTDWFMLNRRDIVRITFEILSRKGLKAEVIHDKVESANAFGQGYVLNVIPEEEKVTYRIGMDALGINLLIACITRDNPNSDPRMWNVARDLSRFESAFASAIE